MVSKSQTIQTSLYFQSYFCSKNTLRKHKWFNSASCWVFSVVFDIKLAWHFTGLCRKTDQHANKQIFVSWSPSCLCEWILSSHISSFWRLAPVVLFDVSSFASLPSTDINEGYRHTVEGEQPSKCQRACCCLTLPFNLNSTQQSAVKYRDNSRWFQC